jgi:hypothetical protein
LSRSIIMLVFVMARSSMGFLMAISREGQSERMPRR